MNARVDEAGASVQANGEPAGGLAAVPPFVGAAGLAMLLLSLAVAAVSLGCTLALTFAWVAAAARRGGTAPTGGERRILVLGLRLAPDGRPGPAYRERLGRAVELLATLPAAGVVVLGGTTRRGAPSEAEAGRRHLATLGVPPARVRVEARSRHTLENLRHYRESFDADGARVVLVTSRSHLARAGLIARGLGIEHTLCAAEPAWAATPLALAAMLRETFFLHWYLVGRIYARLTRDRAMLARIG